MRQVDRDVLPLRVALKHTFEGELAADAAFFVAAIGVRGEEHRRVPRYNGADYAKRFTPCVAKTCSPNGIVSPLSSPPNPPK
jgi:hypothetical protein